MGLGSNCFNMLSKYY